MEGKRFGVGLAAGLLLGLTLVAVSGGLGATPLAQFSPNGGAAGITAASSTSTLAISSTTLATVTYTVTSTTTYGGSSFPSQLSNESKSLTSSSTTTIGITSTSASSTTSGAPSDQGVVTSTNGGNTNGILIPAGNYSPTRLANLMQQPIVSNAEILAPVLIAFLLGAFLYRVTVKERGRSDAET